MSFKRLDLEDISISAESVVAPMWSTNTLQLSTFFTSSAQIAAGTGDFYYRVYDKDPSIDSTPEQQFAIAFGDKTGRGTAPYNANVQGNSSTSTVYGQYRSLIFGDEDTSFTFQNQTSDYIYIITLDRARYKEKLLPGTFNLTLGVGSNRINLTDNSNNISTVSYVDAGRIYDIISGSNGVPPTGKTGLNALGGSYGKFLPDVGLIVLNGTALTTAFGGEGGIGLVVTLGTTRPTPSNLTNLFNAIKLGSSFKLQSEETVSSNYIFVRVRNSEFNYSTNPSNITGSGELRHDVMVNSPQAYITTVGLYNDNNDLLGVAKLSRPLLKDFTKEALVRIKLDY
jgi:hypothetical protein